MSNFDLSMSNFLVPGLRNYQPKVGKMKSPGVSLTTLEVVNNMATPYTRVFTMTDGDTVSGPVEADCTVIYRTTASQQLDLTSLKGSPGVKINFILEGSGSLELALSSGVQRTTHTLTPQASIAQVYPLNSGGMQSGWVVGSSGGSGGGTVGVNIFDAIYPVGSLYWSSKPTNPSTLFGGTWKQIKDMFVLACGDTYTNGATGGYRNTTLGVENLPTHSHGLNRHTHSFTPSGTVSAHSHGLNSHTHSFTPSGKVSAHVHKLNNHRHVFTPDGTVAFHSHSLNAHTHSFSATTGGTGKHSHNVVVGAASSPGGGQFSSMQRHKEGSMGNFDFSKGYSATQTGDHSHTVSGTTGSAAGSTLNTAPAFTGIEGLTSGNNGDTASTTPTFTGTGGTTGEASGNTTNATPTFTGTLGTTGQVLGNTTAVGSGTAFSNMPPYVAKYCWERIA